MQHEDEYITIRGISKVEIYIKQSKFIGLATSINSEQDALCFLQSVKTKYPDATHHCFAYTIGFGAKKQFRSSDAGEPANSAGKPILSIIESSEFNNIICVVVRYFGGIKLGVGGLIRAYSQTAKNCLKNAEHNVFISTTNLQIEMPNNFIGAVVNSIERLRGKILRMDHAEQTRVEINIRTSLIHELEENIKAISSDISIHYL